MKNGWPKLKNWFSRAWPLLFFPCAFAIFCLAHLLLD